MNADTQPGGLERVAPGSVPVPRDEMSDRQVVVDISPSRVYGERRLELLYRPLLIPFDSCKFLQVTHQLPAYPLMVQPLRP